ncbi:hypothetical protein AX15_003377 [Amanita polypyramis BW_CC]|nr:hypothetical protein AX15_003377 [Amanita polypyramis BW_CC]
MNSLTTDVGLKVGPILIETLVKHYFERLGGNMRNDPSCTQLKQDELLYDEVFNLIKAFMKAACFHSVEELQELSNTRTPSPPWTRIVRLLIPLSSCDKAASYLIQALGGEEHARTVVGGVKWWQVRGLDGIEAQWITAKKDWREAKKRCELQRKAEADGIEVSNNGGSAEDSLKYEEAMDDMRCILYLHGGGYFFGSVDQERYSIERYARKINGRVLAINYRLAPQYPFPCALQDALAAYFFLIEPPSGSDHRPVNPAQIVVAGDSAGGGLSLALLQVLRDVGLPSPAGGVLISPWSDMTHSFPSIHTNTDTDIMPHWGLSLLKPSVLWPPPTDERTQHIHNSLRSRIRQAIGYKTPRASTSTVHPTQGKPSAERPLPIDIGSTTSVPSLNEETIRLVTESGEILTINSQVQLYAQNSLLVHPLVSPALSYLGGLPPLLFIASNGEVLRDEIIYTAHKAANPAQYAVHPLARDLYPPLREIEGKYSPTKVHLQVYDDAAHVLPVLFAFTTPAKYCFRAIATFCKHVTKADSNLGSPPATSKSMPNMPFRGTHPHDDPRDRPMTPITGLDGSELRTVRSAPAAGLEQRSSLRRSLSERMQQAAHAFHRMGKRKVSLQMPSLPEDQIPDQRPSAQSRPTSDVGGSRFGTLSTPVFHTTGERYAGDPTVYSVQDYEELSVGPMIRERVSTRGIIRPLEPESDLIGCNVPPDVIGFLSERAIKRYLESAAMFNKKFARHAKAIEKHRHHNLKLAEREATRNLEAFRDLAAKRSKETKIAPSTREPTLLYKGWAWALDAHEKPPPSSIVARRDTKEARKLAEIADRSILQEDQVLSANNFWSLLVNFFTTTPDRFTFNKEKSPRNIL